MEQGLTNQSMTHRRHLLTHNVVEITRRICDAGISDPVGMIIDVTDEMGKMLTYQALQRHGYAKHEIPEIIAKYTKDGATPTFLCVVHLEAARKVLQATSETASENLSKALPPDRAWVVVVGAGGNSYAQVPIERGRQS
jgi:hypothetical protein